MIRRILFTEIFKTTILGVIAMLMPILFAVFTFFIFGPLELYLVNAGELWFSMGDILPITIITGIIAALFFCFIYFIIPAKFKFMVIAFIWGIGIALYLQGNFMQISYGVLDGKEVDWGRYSLWAVMNTIIWCVCVIGPLITARFKKDLLKKIMTFTSSVIIAAQLATLGILCLTADISKGNHVVTTEGLYALSRNKNIVVFILDTFDSDYANEILQKDPDILQSFEDFTYYNNTLAMYPTTKPSLPFLLTGIPYKNESVYNEYLDDAFEKTHLYKILGEKSYTVGIYTGSDVLSKKIVDFTDNVTTDTLKINKKLDFTRKLYQFVAIKYWPHIIKPTIWMYSGEFDAYKEVSKAEYEPYLMGHSYDVEFNNNLINSGFSLTDRRNVFRFYHLVGAHPPYKYGADIQLLPQENNGNYYDQSKGALQIVLNYIAQLKKNGIYDNTLMLIMADHGNKEYSQKPLLMIKDWNSDKPFSLSDIPITYDNIVPMLESRVNGGESCEDFLNSASLNNDIRYFYYYEWDEGRNKLYLPFISEYMFIDGKNDALHARLTGKTFGGNAPQYTLATNLYFTNETDSDKYFSSGISMPGSSFTWSDKQSSIFRALIEPIKGTDLKVDIECAKGYSSKEYQTIRVSANDQFIEEKQLYPGDSAWSFFIPKNLLNDDHVLTLKFEYPDVISPQTAGVNQDTRPLAVAYKRMTISEVTYDQAFNKEIASYELDTPIYFSRSEHPEPYLTEGFSVPEDAFTWSDGTRSVFEAYIESPLDTDFKVDIASSIINNAIEPIYLSEIKAYQTVHIYANGHFIEEKFLYPSDAQWSFIIPGNILKDDHILTLTFEYPDAVSPADLGGGDTRLLAVAFKQMTISEWPRSSIP
jgi:hypothetical protein